MKKIILLILILIAAFFFFAFVKIIPDVYTDLGRQAYEKGDYAAAYTNLKTALSFNAKSQDARYYFIRTISHFRPNLMIQQDYYDIAKMHINDSAGIIATKKLTKWKENIIFSVGSNYIERVPYNGKVLRWDAKKFPLKVYVQNNSASAPAYYQEQIKSAFEQWRASSMNLVSFTFVNSEQDADIFVSIIPSDTTSKCREEGCKYSVAYTTPKIDGDLLAQMRIFFYDSNNLGKPFAPQDIYSTAMHEIGHALGIMGHSQTPGDLMYMEGNSETMVARFKTITQNDINTLTLLYKLVPDITNTPLSLFDKKGQFLAGVVLGDEEKITSAKIAEAQNYIKSAPNLPNGYMDLASAYSEVKEYNKAIGQFQKALSLCTNDDEKYTVYYNMMAMYMSMRDWKDAIVYANFAKSINADDDIDGAIGYIYYNLGKKDLAKASYTEALQKDPTNVVDSINLSLIYLKEFNLVMSGRVLNNLVVANPEAKDDSRIKPFSLLMKFFK